ncbi:hypothetical protein [Enterococcus casseliflavus]|uniref:hypothetical protein n=1 Tax=Enterococcus casseliflavus TaxID=37734 RepID=UPI00115DE47F|nr:hypothetical protein [Enterococcus casseliflavus]
MGGEKKKAFAVKILDGISKWLHDRIFPIILFSIISIIGLEIKKNEQKIKIFSRYMYFGISITACGKSYNRHSVIRWVVSGI